MKNRLLLLIIGRHFVRSDASRETIETGFLPETRFLGVGLQN